MSKQDLTYQIQHDSLEKGRHDFDFKVDESLFARFANDELRQVDFDVHAVLEKHNNHFLLQLSAHGQADLQCDRCLDDYTQEMNPESEIMIKLAEETNYDLDEDFVTLDRDSNSIDIAYFIFELIILNLPLKRVHPDDEDGNSTCNPEVTKYIAGESTLAPDDGSSDNEDSNTGNDDWKNDLKDLIN